ncbi:MAG: hypothetical protein AB1744_12600, partial [Candidatus Zixiibacteriota bacterium]
RPHRESPGHLPGIVQKQENGVNLLRELYRSTGTVPSRTSERVAKVDLDTGEVLSETRASESPVAMEPADSARLLGQFLDLYLLVQIGDNLYVIDQHTAHERVLYEQTLAALERDGSHGQNLLFPLQVELSPEQMATFEEAANVLSRSGFAVAPFGGRTVNIEAVPSVLSAKPPEKTFLAIIDDLLSLKKAGHDLNKAMAQSLACRSAVMAGDRLTDEEAMYLVTRLLQCRDRYSCPHGRPTFVRISKADLDRQFGRA